MKDLELPLPVNLEVEALNLATLQEAYENVEQFQVEARLKLFKALAYHAIQPGTPTLDAALTALCSSAAYLLPDTPEYQLAQYAQHFRTMSETVSQMTKDLAQQQAESDLGEQFSEFRSHLHQESRLSILCAIETRIKETCATEAAASVAETLEHHCCRSELQLRQVLDEGCKAMARLLPPHHHDHQQYLPSLPDALHSTSSQEQGGALFMCSNPALPSGMLQGSGEGYNSSEGVVEVKASEIWGAASVLGELQSRLQTMSDMLVQGVLVPLLKGRHVLRLEKSPEEASELPSPMLHSRASGGVSPPGSEPSSSRSLRHQGSSLSTQARKCRSGCKLEWYVPAAPHKAAAPVESTCLTLLKLLVNIVFDLDEGLLKTFEPYLVPAVEAAVGRVLGAAQTRHLAAARALLMMDLMPQHADEPVLVGQPVALDSPFYQRLLRGECHQWELSDPPCGVAEGNKVAARALVGSVHKFALLARELPCSLPPSIAASLRGVPLLGFVHHNSLLYLADALLLLQASHAVTQQVQHLHELMAGLQGLRWVGLSGTAQAGIASRRAVAQVIHSLGRWGRIVTDTLMPESIVEVCCQCLAAICSTVVADIMAKSDIGIDDCRELRDILGPLVWDVMPVLIPTLQPGSQQGQQAHGSGEGVEGKRAVQQQQQNHHHQHALSGVPVELLRKAIEAQCMPLRKLRMLMDVLDAPMKQIARTEPFERMEKSEIGQDQRITKHIYA
ncbi:hypothetical protein DUNSADRAFT_8144 [Dunaliella salina]|uniref:Uncharacterized protein n=1 Tax=Dunaliella salina TaxID=3046 RepID=A0ABQ7GK14_DUNSA|nr:hypothetical protein DUNSADRAFT_8144 [Dunaliella salina]|eukprot:KAF5834918.1 hypothetical protein DUNSADRAFT_8144 [Dunaliella salina]